MATDVNPRKKYQFACSFDGLNDRYCQKIKLPDVSFDSDEHGDGPIVIPTHGLKKYSTLTLEKLENVLGPDDWIWSWVYLMQDEGLGGGLPPIAIQKTIRITQRDYSMVNSLAVYEFQGCWPEKVNGIELDKVSSDNIMQTIEFKITRMRKI